MDGLSFLLMARTGTKDRESWFSPAKGQLKGHRTPNQPDSMYRIDLTGKFSWGVEHFYAAIWGQLTETKEVSVGFRDALVKAVGEASRGSL